MRMHALNQPIQRRHFSILVKCDHIPPLPTFSIFAKEPLLHDHVGIQPEIPSSLEQPVLSAVCVELVIVAVALFRSSAEMSQAWERGTNFFDPTRFASVGRVGFHCRRAVLFKQFDALGLRGVVPDIYGYGLHDCVGLGYGHGHFFSLVRTVTMDGAGSDCEAGTIDIKVTCERS
jgi:hypothetical protein